MAAIFDIKKKILYSSEMDFDIDNCEHKEISDGCCETCGIAIYESEYSFSSTYTQSHARAPTKTYLGFDKDLASLDIPEEIKVFILKKTSNAEKKTHRMGCRNKIIFAYVYLGCLQHGYDFEPEDIIEKIGLKKSLLGDALRLASGISTIKLPQSADDIVFAPLVVISPVTYLKKILKTYHEKVDDVLDEADLKIFSDLLLKSEPSLYEETPKWVAMALLKYYLETKNKNLEKFYDIFDIKSASVRKSISKNINTFKKEKN